MKLIDLTTIGKQQNKEPEIDIYKDIQVDEFPLLIIPENYQRYIREASESLNFSKDYLACGMLSVFSFLIGNRIKLQVKKGYNANGIVWLAIVASRGAIKSHPLNLILSPIKALEKKRYDSFQDRLAAYNDLPKDEKAQSEAPEFHPIKISNATAEGLQKNLEINKAGVMLHFDELSGFFNALNSYKGGKGSDVEFMLSGFNNDDFSVIRKVAGNTYLQNIYFTVAGTIQYEVLAELGANFQDNGMLDRFLYTKSESMAYGINEKEISREMEMFWEKRVEEIYEVFEDNFGQPDQYLTINFTKAGFDAFREYDLALVNLQNDPDTDNRMIAYYSKMRTYLPRFSLILCIMEMTEYNTPLEVSEVHVYKANKLVEYFSKTAESIFVQNTKSKDINTMLATMKSKSRKEKIEALLTYKEYKLTDIAKAMNVSKQYVSKIKNAIEPLN